MRVPVLIVAAMTLASCNSQSGNEQAAAGNALTAPPVAAEAPAANQQAAALPAGTAVPEPQAAAEAKTIPAAFQGVYDATIAACSAPSEYRMEVTPGELRFHESIGKVRGVAGAAADPN
jgi:hypothetical protein